MKPHLLDLISDDDDCVKCDVRTNRPYMAINADILNRIYSTLYQIIHDQTSVLDLGCLIGSLAVFLRKAGWDKHYTGVDIQDSFIDIAKKISPDEFFYAKDAKLFLKNTLVRYDVVVCLGLLHAFVEPFTLLNLLIKRTQKFLIVDSRNFGFDMDGNHLQQTHDYELISNICSTPTMDKNGNFSGHIRGYGNSISPAYIELFMNDNGWEKLQSFDTSLLINGVYGKYSALELAKFSNKQVYIKMKDIPIPQRTIQCFVKTGIVNEDILQNDIKKYISNYEK